MIYSEIELNTAEEQLREYFRCITFIHRFKNKLEVLNKQRESVKKELNDITLSVPEQGVCYNTVQVQHSYNGSTQEKAIDLAYARLERQLDKINEEITNVNIDIRNFELESCDIRCILDMMDDDSKMYIELRYDKKKSNTHISQKLNFSPATITRLRIKILTAICNYRHYEKTMKKT